MTFDKLKSQKEDQNPLAGDALSLSKSDALSLSKWEEKKLGEVCEILDRLRKPITKKDRIEGDYPYYGATGILSYVDNYIFSEKLVLIGEDGAKWQSGDNTAFIVDGKYWVNNHAHVIRPDRKIILDDWIVYYLNFSDLTSFITGVTVPKLNQEKMRDIDIPLPPLSEQKKIVEVLDQAFAGIEQSRQNTKQNLKNAKEIFESYLQLAMTPPQGDALSLSKSDVFGGSASSPTNKGDALSSSKSDALSLSKWEEKKLGEVLVKTETTDPTKNPITEFTYLDVSSVNKETKKIETPTVLLGKDAPSRAKKLVRTGDIIFATVRPTHSRVALIPEEFDEQVCSTGYFVLRTKESVSNKLVFYFLLTNSFNEQMEKLQKGASYPAVTDNDVKGILFSFPKSKIEQQTIVHQLDTLRAETQKLEEIYAQKLNDLEELKKSLLQKAFAGELVK